MRRTLASPPVGLVGTGLLRDAVHAVLGDRVIPLEQATTEPLGALVVVSDAWDTTSHDRVRQIARQHDVAWLPVRTELSHVVMGPLEVTGRAGCVACATERQRRNRPDRDAFDAVWRRQGDRLATRASSLLTRLAAHLVATLVADEVAPPAPTPPRTLQALLRVDLATLAVTRHTFLPDPSCEVCAGHAELPEATRLTLSSRPTHRPGSYRVRAIAAEFDDLTSRYVDKQVGLVRSIDAGRDGVLVAARAPYGWRGGGADAGYGWDVSSSASRLTALLEALERYAGESPPTCPVTTGTYRELGGRALDPRVLGLHSTDQYAQPGFGLRPFAVDRPYRWVSGWSFAREQPIYVPERYAYYAVPGDRGDGPAFVYEISNGYALGGCLEEAILYGILEVAERDAFLLTWYAQLPARPVDLTAAHDRAVPLLAGAIRSQTGYELRVFDISVEQRIPCMWAMAVNPVEDGRPAAACAAGSHLSREVAIRKALQELGPSLENLISRYARPTEAARARAMAADPYLVTTMDDHALLYADPRAAERLRFLTRPARVPTGAAPEGAVVRGPAEPARDGDDLRDCLLATIASYTRHGMDVIVVDQTTPEHRAGGLSCVKVIIPGTMPMTFGHAYRRVSGLPRLSQAPRRAGVHDHTLGPDEVNPHPHPFP